MALQHRQTEPKAVWLTAKDPAAQEFVTLYLAAVAAAGPPVQRPPLLGFLLRAKARSIERG